MSDSSVPVVDQGKAGTSSTITDNIDTVRQIRRDGTVIERQGFVPADRLSSDKRADVTEDHESVIALGPEDRQLLTEVRDYLAKICAFLESAI